MERHIFSVSILNMSQFPKISILIAARNEAANIEKCLEALTRLSYPPEHLEIWIGNDGSSDNTAELIEKFTTRYAHIHLLNITGQMGTARGKANVLAHLVQRAQGKYWLFTDADIEVPPTWVETMIAAFKNEKVGVVTGITSMSGNSWFAKMQAIDWLANLFIIKLLSFLKIPITAMGNNMAVLPEAYRAVGGYENLPFSLTEDYKLFSAILDKGYTFEQCYSPEILVQSAPMPTLEQLLQQRNRWITGASRDQQTYRIIVALLALTYGVAAVCLVIWPQVFLLLWLGKFLLQTLVLAAVMLYLRQPRLLRGLITFELYAVIFTAILLVYHYRNTDVQWKERVYS
jgi:cellulose synthase/poly-beta-1,6-N-acetylglucosamine synthase-like glycosyltransferase